MFADEAITWIILAFLVIIIIIYSFASGVITKDDVINAQQLAQNCALEAQQMYQNYVNNISQ